MYMSPTEAKTRNSAPGGPRIELRASPAVCGKTVCPVPEPHRIFLLSPANVAGIRGRLIMSSQGKLELANRLRGEGVPLGEVFTFISGLYFRGKVAYARAFAAAPSGVSGTFVITACGGLVPPDTVVTLEQLREISAGCVDCEDLRYRHALDRDALALSKATGTGCQIVLLGSIATPKYTKPLLEIFGERLFFPIEFVGRGDMSRGGLMLRRVSAGVQLNYVPVARAQRYGPKPPKLAPLDRA
jgi:hypothetical protein